MDGKLQVNLRSVGVFQVAGGKWVILAEFKIYGVLGSTSCLEGDKKLALNWGDEVRGRWLYMLGMLSSYVAYCSAVRIYRNTVRFCFIIPGA